MAVIASAAGLATGACGGTDSTDPKPPSMQTVSLTESATRAKAASDSVTLSWSSRDATSCDASGAWSGSKPVSGSALIKPATVGQSTFTLSCSGAGGVASANANLDVWLPLAVLATSYGNFKDVGVATTAIPNSATRGYGDFYQDGSRALFTASQLYDVTKPASEAVGARYEFWHFAGGQWVLDNSILTPIAVTCVHPRQALVADFNGDGKPDIFLACTGYDAPPFPGEKSQVVMSGPSGKYVVQDANSAAAYWHGAAAADMNGDGKIDVVIATGHRPSIYLNDGAGHFTLDPVDPFSSIVPEAPYYSVQIADVNEDGIQDVLVGGVEYATCPECTTCPTCITAAKTLVLLGSISGTFQPVELPSVAGQGTVLDFAVTGSGSSRTVWVNRTSGATGAPSYNGRALQQIQWSGLSFTTPYSDSARSWVQWIVPVRINGTAFMATDDSRDGFTPVRVP